MYRQVTFTVDPHPPASPSRPCFCPHARDRVRHARQVRDRHARHVGDRVLQGGLRVLRPGARPPVRHARVRARHARERVPVTSVIACYRVGYVFCDPVLACLSVTPVLLLNQLPSVVRQHDCLLTWRLDRNANATRACLLNVTDQVDIGVGWYDSVSQPGRWEAAAGPDDMDELLREKVAITAAFALSLSRWLSRSISLYLALSLSLSLPRRFRSHSLPFLTPRPLSPPFPHSRSFARCIIVMARLESLNLKKLKLKYRE